MNKNWEVCCNDCNREYPEQFMACDSVWLSAAKENGHLCLDCFKKRLGRDLTPDDFPWNILLNMENDRVRVICGFKPLTEEEKKQLNEFVFKER